LLFPELTVRLDPFSRALHGVGGQSTAMNSPFLAPCDKLGPFEHPQVLGNARKRDVEGRGQVAHGGFALRQARQNAAPGRVGKRAEGRVEMGVEILNHVV